MKKINLLFVVLFATIISVSTSCKKKEDPTGPTLTVTADTTTVNPGDTVVFTYSVSSNADLKTLTWSSTSDVLVDGVQEDGGSFELEGTSDQNNEFTVVMKSTIEDVTFTFTAEDKDGAEYAAEKTVVITVEAEVADCGTITTHEEFTLGSFDNAEASFFASIDGSRYTVSGAASNQSKIDFVYGYGATNHATIFAPSDATSGMASVSEYGITSWTTKNATKFKKVSASYTWSTIVKDCDIVSETATGVTESYIKDLANGDIVAFITVGGKKGFIKVNTIYGTSSAGSIKLEVKVQD
jgi:hypothetical protein